MFKIIKVAALCVFCLIVMGVSILYGFSGYFAPANLEEELVPDASSQFYDNKGELIYTSQSEERRLPVTLDKVPKHTRLAFIAIEDNRFYEHGGIDYRGTLRALFNNVLGREVQGGSTITQQLAKNAFLSQERTFKRKIREAFIAKELEDKYTKDEILEMYLNRIYFGQGAYGVESAALYYFGKHAAELDIAESACLAAIPKSPNYYNPFADAAANKERTDLVIDQMVKYGFISEAAGDTAKAEKLTFNEGNKQQIGDPRFYFFDMVSQKVIEEFGADALYKGGMKIYTTLDLKMQEAAEKALHFLPTYYTDGEKRRQPQVALIAIDPETGYVKAMVGGRGDDKFNRATLAVRQPGSSFKPFVYLTAMQSGLTPATVIEDKEEKFDKDWTPKNSDLKWHGLVSLRTALKLSINVPAVKLAKEVGVHKIIANAEKMGITTLVDKGPYNDMNLAMAIGGLTKGVNPLEMAAAYGVLATNGIYCRPFSVLKIVDREGKTVYSADTESHRVLDPVPCYLTTNMLQDVLTSGTAAVTDLGRDAAGKTGTTDDFKDAWFVGYTPNLSCAVWIGDDNGRQMEKMYGSMQPLSIWEEFMREALKEIPAKRFVNPGVTVPPEPKIDKKTKAEIGEDKDKADAKDKEKADKRSKENNKTTIIKNKGNDEDKMKEKEKEQSSEPPSWLRRARSGIRERISEAGGDRPVISNRPTKAGK